MPVDLNFSQTGQGEDLIILHGLFGSSSNWRSVARALSLNHTVYTLDARNHGDSPWSESMQYNNMADDLANFISRHNLKSAHVLGHSMGGKTAMTFALNYPELVKKLIIADISPQSYTHGNEHHRFIDAMLALDLEGLTGGRKQAQLELTRTLKEPGPVIQFLLQNLNFKNERYQWRINLPVLRDSLKHIMGNIDVSNTNQSEVKSLFVYGKTSNYVTQEHQPQIKRLFPNASFIGIDNAGHWLHAEQPQKFIEAVNGFLNADSVNI